MNRVGTIAIWVSIVLASLAFAVAGIGKLVGVAQLHISFYVMGLPEWFGYFIGACELLGAVGLWQQRISFYAAASLLGIMFGAIYFHTRFDAIVNAIPAMILSLLLVKIMFDRFKERLKVIVF